jgi:hypothetical protein
MARAGIGEQMKKQQLRLSLSPSFSTSRPSLPPALLCAVEPNPHSSPNITPLNTGQAGGNTAFYTPSRVRFICSHRYRARYQCPRSNGEEQSRGYCKTAGFPGGIIHGPLKSFLGDRMSLPLCSAGVNGVERPYSLRHCRVMPFGELSFTPEPL